MSKKTVLYIEDTGDFREFHKSILEEDGFRVIECESARMAIFNAKKYKEEINVILLDIMMPHEDLFKEEESKKGFKTGILLIDEINKVTGKKLPIVVYTAVTNKEIIDELNTKKQIKKIFRKTEDFEKIIEEIAEGK